MKVVCDSSGCCGIKHIRDFYWSDNPDKIINIGYAKGHEEDCDTCEPPAYERWEIVDKTVARTAGDHLRFLVTQIKRRRPSGMITVNLVESYDEDDDEYDSSIPDNWNPLLTELGFTKIVFRNSNSNNLIHHYTLVYDEEM